MENETFLTEFNLIKSPKIKTKKIKKLLQLTPNSNSTFDGLALLSHRVTIKDEIDKLFSPQPKGKNIIFNKPFPLLSVISKRTLLNKTPYFIPKLINCSKKKILKKDQKLILSVNEKEKEKKEKNNNENNINENIILKTVEAYHKRSKSNFNFKNLKIFSYNLKPKFKLRNYSRNHDTNFYNREYFVKEPIDFYENNSFKIKKFIKEVKFMEKIKDDVSKLKFNNTLRVNLNFKSI